MKRRLVTLILASVFGLGTILVFAAPPAGGGPKGGPGGDSTLSQNAATPAVPGGKGEVATPATPGNPTAKDEVTENRKAGKDAKKTAGETDKDKKGNKGKHKAKGKAKDKDEGKDTKGKGA